MPVEHLILPKRGFVHARHRGPVTPACVLRGFGAFSVDPDFPPGRPDPVAIMPAGAPE